MDFDKRLHPKPKNINQELQVQKCKREKRKKERKGIEKILIYL